jgi:hypothetical protein
MRRIHVLGSVMLIGIFWIPLAVALEDCNTSPKDGRDITEALQCLDRNLRSLAPQSGGGAAGPAKSESPIGRYIAGAYTSPDGKQKFQMTGPTKIGTREKWQLSSDDGLIQAAWITGPPKGHPMLLGDKLVDELSEAYDYGRFGKTSLIDNTYWYQGRLIGVTPTNDGLIVSRLGDNSKDLVIESASFTLRLSRGSR